MQGPGAPRPGMLKGGRSKAAAVPDPTKQHDRHTQVAGLLLRAELAPDPLERMLAVCRVVLCLCTDLLRPGSAFQDTPALILSHHYLSKRQLADKHRGDAMQLFLQELCSHEPLALAQPAKYTGGSIGGIASTGNGGSSGGSGGASTAGGKGAGAGAGAGRVPDFVPAVPTAGGAAPPAALLHLNVQPVAAARQQHGGLLSQLGAGAKAAAAAATAGAGGPGAEGPPAAWLECSLQGGLEVAFPRHVETYACTLPTLVLANPLAQACPLDFSGTCTVECEASGLSASLTFKPFRGGVVKGAVEALLGDGRQQVAAVRGSWQGSVTAESEDGAGVLFEASHLLPPACLTINLAEPGPRATTRLWAALLESLVFLNINAAAREGKRAAELAAALPPHLKKSLLFEIERSGLKSNQQAAAEEEASPPPTDPNAPAASTLLPPCILTQRSMHGGLAYQALYRVQPVALAVV